LRHFTSFDVLPRREGGWDVDALFAVSDELHWHGAVLTGSDGGAAASAIDWTT
jgi:hypothetical protein